MQDVIVIGAGPAGNIAALRLSGLGHSVTVLDWRRNVGDKLCTGIIGVECAQRFPPDADHVYMETGAATVVSPAGQRYRIGGAETRAFIIDRVAYVDSLARRAMAEGAQYLLGSRVVDVQVSQRCVTVLTSGDEGRDRLEARVVILASGFGSPLLGMVGLRNGRTPDYMVGCQAEVEVDDLEDTEVYLGEQLAAGSFGWLVPCSDSRALMGLVSRRRENGHMGWFLSSLQGSGKVKNIIKEPQQWGIPLKPLPKTYGDRVLVVGDAAGMVKPTTGGGIYYALLSGEIAAGTASEALLAEDFAGHRLKRYEKAWKAVFGKELKVGYYTRMLFEAMGDRQVESLLQKFASREVQSDLISSKEFSFDWHSRTILKGVRHGELDPLIRSFGSTVNLLLSRLLRTTLS